MMCEICGRKAVAGQGFCAVHLALWLQYATMPRRCSTREQARAAFVKWQRGK